MTEPKKEEKHGHLDNAWKKAHVADLHLPVPFTVLPTVSCADACEILKSQGIDQLPVVTDTNEILGTITEGNVRPPCLSRTPRAHITRPDSLSAAVEAHYRRGPRVQGHLPPVPHCGARHAPGGAQQDL